MRSTTEIQILDLIWQNPGIHVRELARRLKLGIPSIKYALEKLKDDKIITPKTEGRNLKFYINFNSKESHNYIPLLNVYTIQKLDEKIRSMTYDLLKSLKIKPLMTIIFGSYALGDKTKTSDLDLLLIYSDKDNPDDIEQKSKI